VVAITGPDRGGWPAWVFTAWAVRRAGGRPLRIRPAKPRHHCRFHALIVGGGADVDPSLYEAPEGPAPHEIQAAERRLSQRLIGYVFYPLLWLLRRLFQSHGGSLDLERDRLEKALIHRALDEHRPILGICRGMQLINVVRGGSLQRDLAGFYTETPRLRSVLPVKLVELEPGSRLAEILGEPRVRVNALHDHAVDALGRNMRVSGCEPAGVIQAIEALDRWCIGVQWHPEYLPQKPVQRRLFQALVADALAADARACHPPDG
jgi:putative glutamine amidotransferase